MGLKSGSMTWHAFSIIEEKAADDLSRGDILERLAKLAFQDPDGAAGETEAQGLVVFEALLERDFEAHSERTFVGPFVFFTFRRDRLRVPAAYLKALVQVEEAAALERSGRQRLGKTEKAAIKERVEAMLLTRALPSIQTADVAWSLQDGTVRVFAGSTSVVEAAAEMFEAAFDVHLLPREPFTRLLDLGHDADELATKDVPQPSDVPALLRAG